MASCCGRTSTSFTYFQAAVAPSSRAWKASGDAFEACRSRPAGISTSVDDILGFCRICLATAAA